MLKGYTIIWMPDTSKWTDINIGIIKRPFPCIVLAKMDQRAEYNAKFKENKIRFFSFKFKNCLIKDIKWIKLPHRNTYWVAMPQKKILNHQF